MILLYVYDSFLPVSSRYAAIHACSLQASTLGDLQGQCTRNKSQQLTIINPSGAVDLCGVLSDMYTEWLKRKQLAADGAAVAHTVLVLAHTTKFIAPLVHEVLSSCNNSVVFLRKVACYAGANTGMVMWLTSIYPPGLLSGRQSALAKAC